MIKKGSYFFGLTILVMLVSTGFNSFEIEKVEGFHLEENENYVYTVPTEDEFEEEFDVIFPYVGKTFVGFREAIAFRESRGILNLVNPYGYMGKYQFGRSTLRTVGIYDFQEFLHNPEWQEKAFKALVARNKWELRKEIKKYSGRKMNGVVITESGILAAAHLAGAGSVKKYLRSNGANGFKDGFGTSLRSYMKKFGGFDVSLIEADANAKVKLD
ncbi:peptidoglycan-binding protein LysM [Flavobacterium sp. NRK F10]|uniref:Peptidoglycan-binding protein LysM n=1 Tax=Flavobacterium sediminis TaxID=2201181 RepID=A0A2U8QSP9_9FLAO|nr:MULTISPECIES: peptidoglycan-binding protein LysM [Flavobacterium]AWM12906.1 peptidoglycan-binding protein LysM [Flavobacterium sediminis]MCO6174037.1 peptidoglycan-binding protein LysM [Flavobacterium sp. NRK F10]